VLANLLLGGKVVESLKVVRSKNGRVRGRTGRRCNLPRSAGLLALGLLCLALSTCDNFDFYGLISGMASGSAGGPLAISPLSATVTVNATCTFTASGGTPPYKFSVTGSGTIDPGTGAYTAPAAPSSDSVQVSDTAGGPPASARVSVVP
jgi:hypothetical protein